MQIYPVDIIFEVKLYENFFFLGFLDWKEFLKLMMIMRTKTLEERLNLFIKV